MERKMLVRGEALGQPHSGIRIEASLGKYVFGVFETTSATCGELRQNRLSYSPRRGSVPYRMFTTYFASVTKRWNGPCTMRRLEAAPLCGQNVCDIFCISEKSSFAQVLDCKLMALVSVSRFSREQDRTFLLATKC